MTIWVVIWVVLMILWLAGGCYWSWDPAKPQGVGNTLLPWACVLILGLIMFGAVGTQPIDPQPHVVPR
jgi:hypothetical protein